MQMQARCICMPVCRCNNVVVKILQPAATELSRLVPTLQIYILADSVLAVPRRSVLSFAASFAACWVYSRKET